MLNWLPESEGNLICLKASGKVTDTDYRFLVPKMNKVLACSTSLRIFADFSAFEGWEWAHALDKFTFAMDDVERVAILGGARAKELSELASATLQKSELRYFENNEKSLAMNWVKE